MRSAMVSASSWSWVTITVVTPRRRCSIFHFVAQVSAHFGVERRQWFIQQQQARRGCEGASQCDALLLAARKLGRVLGALVR